MRKRERERHQSWNKHVTLHSCHDRRRKRWTIWRYEIDWTGIGTKDGKVEEKVRHFPFSENKNSKQKETSGWSERDEGGKTSWTFHHHCWILNKCSVCRGALTLISVPDVNITFAGQIKRRRGAIKAHRGAATDDFMHCQELFQLQPHSVCEMLQNKSAKSPHGSFFTEAVKKKKSGGCWGKKTQMQIEGKWPFMIDLSSIFTWWISRLDTWVRR